MVQFTPEYSIQDKMQTVLEIDDVIQKICSLKMEIGEIIIQNYNTVLSSYPGLKVNSKEIIFEKNSFAIEYLKQNNELETLRQLIHVYPNFEEYFITIANQNEVLVIKSNKSILYGYDDKIGLKEIDTQLILKIFKIWRNFIHKYETCNILGVIPNSKLDSWVSVPKEFVKDEWWNQNVQKEGY